MTGVDISRARPATPKMIATRLSILTAPRPILHNIIALMWEADGRWWYMPGYWHSDWNCWVADIGLTGGRELPSVPTHWAEMS